MKEVTSEDYTSTLKVLEILREKYDGEKHRILNDVHYLVQLHQKENQ